MASMKRGNTLKFFDNLNQRSRKFSNLKLHNNITVLSPTQVKRHYGSEESSFRTNKGCLCY